MHSNQGAVEDEELAAIKNRKPSYITRDYVINKYSNNVKHQTMQKSMFQREDMNNEVDSNEHSTLLYNHKRRLECETLRRTSVNSVVPEQLAPIFKNAKGYSSNNSISSHYSNSNLDMPPPKRTRTETPLFKSKSTSAQYSDVNRLDSQLDNVSQPLRDSYLPLKVTPLLPAKRPPRRIKSISRSQSNPSSIRNASSVSNASCVSSASSSAANTNSAARSYEKPDDDTISFCASSLCSEDNVNTSIEKAPVNFPNTGHSQRKSFNENIETPGGTMHTDIEPEGHLQDFLELNNPVHVKNKVNTWMKTNKADFSIIPPIFKKLCYYQFALGMCKHSDFCSRTHYVPNKIKNDFQRLSVTQQIAAYEYAKQFYSLQRETFSHLVNVFQFSHFPPILITLVGDVLSNEFLNKTSFINEILASLCKIGMSLNDAINEIVKKHGGERNTCLTDILLDIICVIHKENICENWNLVQNLIKDRVEPIDYGVVEEIMIISYEHNSNELATNIIKDIIQPDRVDLKLVRNCILNRFLFMVHNNKLRDEEVSLRAKIKLNNLIVDPPIPPIKRNQSKLPVNEVQSNEPDKLSTHNINAHGKSDLILSAPELNTTKKMNDENDTSRAILHDRIDSESDFEEDEPYNIEVAKKHSSKSAYPRGDKNISEENFASYTQFHIKSTTCTSKNGINTDVPNLVKSNLEDILSDESVSYPTSPVYSDSPYHGQLVDGKANSSLSDHSNQFCPTSPVYSESSFHDQLVDDNASPRLSEDDGNVENIHHGGGTSPIYAGLYESKLLTATEVMDLEDLIEESNDKQYIEMLYEYKDEASSQEFVLNSIVKLTTKSSEHIYNFVFEAIDNLASIYPNFMNMDGLNNMISMLAVNAIALLENDKKYKEASNILLTFQDNFHKLKDTVWLTPPHRYDYSESGKFLYFCKILVRSDHVHEAWDILKSNDKMLLYGVAKWKFPYNTLFDNILRNHILRELIGASIATDLQFAKSVILYIINNKVITEIDIWKYFNEVVRKMLGGSVYLEELLSMKENIIEGWYNHLNPEVLRALLITLKPTLTHEDMLEMYSKCCKRKCYPYLRGYEKQITLDTTWLETEISVMLQYYFYKKAKNSFPLDDLVLLISPPKLLKVLVFRPEVDLRIKDMKTKIYTVLKTGLPIVVNVDHKDTEDKHILIEKEKLQLCFEYYVKHYQTT